MTNEELREKIFTHLTEGECEQLLQEASRRTLPFDIEMELESVAMRLSGFAWQRDHPEGGLYA
jgi:hypothetical protein